MRIGTNIAVFFLFFGVSLLEAFRNHNWILSLFWITIGFVFLLADNLKKNRHSGNNDAA